MAISRYLKWLREYVGSAELLMPSVAAAVFDDEGRVLLAQDAGTGLWTMPGGAIDPGERPAQALVREIREELGVEVEPVAVLGVFGGPGFGVEYPNGDRVTYVVTVFSCKVVGGEITPDGEEVADFRFVRPGEYAGLRVPPWARHVLSRLAEDGNGGGARFDPP